MRALKLLVLAAVGLLLSGCGYNTIQVQDEATKSAWSEVVNQYQRRADLIPNLVNTVKGSMQFEKETLDAVISARARAMQAAGGGGGSAPPNVKEVAAAEAALTASVGKFFAVMEAYPDLKSSQNVRDLQEELSSTENKIAFARQLYNDVATQYNTKQMQFPTNMVAGLAKATPAELWEITDQAERAVPNVDLSFGGGDKPKA